MSQRNLVLLLLAVVVSYACFLRGDQDPYARYIGDGFEAIRHGSLDSLPNQELFDGAMKGMVAVLEKHGDQHSQFLPESEAEPLRAEISQQFGGIGVQIGFEGKTPQLTIVAPPEPGTPAAENNLLPGDRILAINGVPTAGMDMKQVLPRMRGEPETQVTLSIQHKHEDSPREVELTRKVIRIDSIRGDRRGPDGHWIYTLEDDPQIAHIRISSFGELTPSELERVLGDLIAQGVKGVVLDLRDNPGGSLDAAVEVCQLLLPAGKTIVETRGRGKVLRRRYATTEDGEFKDLPLAVMVNQNSASAAEIVAACLQDDGRAIVGGQKSYGKGTVQQLLPMEAGKSLLKLTWASFWRPSGENIHRKPGDAKDGAWGVSPDTVVKLELSADEYVAYRKYRNQRDQYVGLPIDEADDTPSDAPTAAEASTSTPVTVKAAKVDSQLQLAVKQLQAELKQ